MSAARLDLKTAALLVVDIQNKILPHMHNADQVVQQTGRLIDGAKALELPILVTEQYPKGLGPTVPVLAERLTNAVCNYEKLKFSACIEPILRQLEYRRIRTVLVCGIEAHVCVLQTCLDMLSSGHLPMVVIDAIGSRRLLDQDVAVQRMVQAAVVPTTVECALLELVHKAGGSHFQAVRPLIK